MADWTVRLALVLLRQQGRRDFQAVYSHADHPRKPRAIQSLKGGRTSMWMEEAGNRVFGWLAACTNPPIELQKGWWQMDPSTWSRVVGSPPQKALSCAPHARLQDSL